MRRIALISGFGLILFGCGGGGDPFGDGGPSNDGAPGADADPNAPDAPASDAGRLACAEAPARLIVLGDSIVACSNLFDGGINSPSCSPLLLQQYVDAEFSSGVTYENKSVAGAVTEDIPDNQLGTIDTGTAGHALVVIYIGGNDLQRYIFASDADAEAWFADDMPAMFAEWDRIFAFFDDAGNFPDGVTMIMNTQYNPFDDCTASPYYLSAVKIDLLHQYNDNLTQLADARGNVVITDQHASYLGHGHHYNVAMCPFYIEGADGWMFDTIHPNADGHANLANEWKMTADRLYRDCIE